MSAAPRFSLRCPSCQARLWATTALLGRSCRCPGCKTEVVVRPGIPADEGAALVPCEEPEPISTGPRSGLR
jgi:hypothetical protein